MFALKPGRIGPLAVANRVVRAATSETMATTGGQVTSELIELHRALANGGVGLSILGHAYVHPRGQSLPHQTGIHRDEMIPGLRLLTSAVHDSGGLIFAQLAHAGSQTGMTDIRPLAPSAVPNALTGRSVEEADDHDIVEAIKAFGEAARRAVDAGFDGIHIHAANGYLISEFNSPSTNRRSDAWGGTPDRRTTFVAAVYDAVRRSAGNEFPVTMKMGMVDRLGTAANEDPGLELGESVARVAALADQGLDGVEVSVGVMALGTDSCHRYVAIDRRRALTDLLIPRLWSDAGDEAYFEPLARAIRHEVPELALILVGGLRTTRTIERVLADDSCDFVALARPLIREPNLVAQIEAGRTGRVDCTSCNLCLDNEGDHRLQCWRTPKIRLAKGAVAHLRRRLS